MLRARPTCNIDSEIIFAVLLFPVDPLRQHLLRLGPELVQPRQLFEVLCVLACLLDQSERVRVIGGEDLTVRFLVSVSSDLPASNGAEGATHGIRAASTSVICLSGNLERIKVAEEPSNLMRHDSEWRACFFLRRLIPLRSTSRSNDRRCHGAVKRATSTSSYRVGMRGSGRRTLWDAGGSRP